MPTAAIENPASNDVDRSLICTGWSLQKNHLCGRYGPFFSHIYIVATKQQQKHSAVSFCSNSSCVHSAVSFSRESQSAFISPKFTSLITNFHLVHHITLLKSMITPPDQRHSSSWYKNSCTIQVVVAERTRNGKQQWRTPLALPVPVRVRRHRCHEHYLTAANKENLHWQLGNDVVLECYVRFPIKRMSTITNQQECKLVRTEISFSWRLKGKRHNEYDK